MSQAIAIIEKRNFSIPDDVKLAAPFVLAHRIIPYSPVKAEGESPEELIEKILKEIAVPL
jgi:MoxR-like ATPase